MERFQREKKAEGTRGGGPRPDFLPPPTELPLRHCRHKNDEGEDLGVVSESRCLLDLLAGQPHGNEHAKNKQHYILATADADEKDQRSKGFIDVRERARMIPGVPIVYVKRSVMILEELSGASERAIRKNEREKFGEGLLGLADRKRKRGVDEEGDAGEDDLLGDEQHDRPMARGMSRAKGPNPLSVKKKKVKELHTGGGEGDGVALEGNTSKKKPTRRGGKRAQKSKAGDTEGSAVTEPTARAASATTEAEA